MVASLIFYTVSLFSSFKVRYIIILSYFLEKCKCFFSFLCYNREKEEVDD